MTFDTFTWDQPGCALIFGFTREQVWGAADAYLAKNPQTRGNTYDCILGYKKGFLQKYQTIVDLLTTQLPKKERPAFRAQLERHCKTVGLGEYIDRAPTPWAAKPTGHGPASAPPCRGKSVSSFPI